MIDDKELENAMNQRLRFNYIIAKNNWHNISDKELLLLLTLFKEMEAKALERIERLRAALSHPDIEHLDCECGWFDPEEPDGDGKHTCIKHFARAALKDDGNE